MTLSAKTCIIHKTTDLILIFSALSTVIKEYLKFQLNQASGFEVIALGSQVSKKIDLYNNHTENKLQVFTLVAITLVCICQQC